MNWNGQRRFLDAAIKRRLDPASAAAIQSEINAHRRNRINDALAVRPVYLPLRFDMEAAGRTSPYRDVTPSLDYDVIITGIQSDAQTREIIVKKTEADTSLLRTGDNLNLNLRVDDISGLSVAVGGGQLGPFYFPTPLILPRRTRLSVEMFKTDTTADPETAFVVLIGCRVYSASYANNALGGGEIDRINRFIAAREIPEIRLLKQVINFDVAGVGGEVRNLYTPRVEEPLLLRGMRTTLEQSAIEFGVTGEPFFTVEPTPIWSVAAEDSTGHENYHWFSKPIFLRSGQTIETRRVVNGLDGVNFDVQNGNTITWIAETV